MGTHDSSMVLCFICSCLQEREEAHAKELKMKEAPKVDDWCKEVHWF